MDQHSLIKVIATDVNIRACHTVMGEEEPEAKDWLGEDIKDGVGNDLGINASDAATIGNTPNAR